MAPDTDISPAAGDARGGRRTRAVVSSAVVPAGLYRRAKLAGAPLRVTLASPAQGRRSTMSKAARRRERARRAALGAPRPYPSLQHQILCQLVIEFPQAIAELASKLGVPIPEGLTPEPVATTYPLGDGEVRIDVCLFFNDAEGEPQYFLLPEVQLEYAKSKLFGVRAYHAAVLRRKQIPGHVLVLSPSAATRRSFLEHEELLREELAFGVTYASGDMPELESFAAAGRPVGYQAIAATVQDFTAGGLAGWATGVAEDLIKAGQADLGDMLMRLIMEHAETLEEVGGVMTLDLAERVVDMPVVRDVVAAREAAAVREAAVREAAAREAAAAAMRDAMLAIFSARNDTPSSDGRLVLAGLTDPETLRKMIQRAADGESSAEILRK